MAAAKSKSARSRSRKSSRPASKRTTKPSTQTTLSEHPFEPGAKVLVYRLSDVEVERADNREPFGDPLAEITVAKDGELKVQASPGTYVAAAKTRERHPRGLAGGFYSYATVVVRDPNKPRNRGRR